MPFNIRKTAHFAFRWLLLIALTACASVGGPAITPTDNGPAADVAQTQQPDLPAMYAELDRGRGGQVFRLEPTNSAVRVYVFRAGQAAKLGHNHVIAAPQFLGFMYLPQSGPADGRFDLEFRLDQLEVDNLAYRGGLGKAFASVPSPEMIAATREHMLSEDNMQADRFPLVRVHSLQIAGDWPKFAAKVQVMMHGQSREAWVPLTVEGPPDHLSVTGAMVLRQSDFGVKPYSVLGGLIAVQDEVVVEFKLAGV
ncbi:MAG TPA: YceI family protein [Casimicrobiaceae bacterium]|nr:YceI family protein [Casimicrobiaceae bacterium]